ncbi:MAG: hypothetical protein KAJ18_10085 [Candidatus Omnitrophica bacterium]|nr:hypothetical protein [Candidatus Omnitrophota bacterium]
MIKLQKTETLQNTTKTSPLRDKIVILQNFFMKNKANFNSAKLTVTSCSTVNYNDLSPKTQNGTKPIKANFRNRKPLAFRARPKQKIKKCKANPISALSPSGQISAGGSIYSVPGKLFTLRECRRGIPLLADRIRCKLHLQLAGRIPGMVCIHNQDTYLFLSIKGLK